VILYLDSSALVKRYVAEKGSAETRHIISRSDVLGTVIITRAEVAAALAKAIRMRVLDSHVAEQRLKRFYADWGALARLPVDDSVVTLAGRLAWDYNLRGYDAVHLASAITWQDALDETVTLATFDKHLWEAAASAGLTPYPTILATYL